MINRFLAGYVSVYGLRVGLNRFRILPALWDGAEHFGFDAWVHDHERRDLCLRKMYNTPCHFCEQDEHPTRCVLYWVIDRFAQHAYPKILIASWLLDRDITSRCMNKKTGETLFIDHPETGYDINIFFKEGSKGDITIDEHQSCIFNNEDDLNDALDWVKCHPIPSCLRPKLKEEGKQAA